MRWHHDRLCRFRAGAGRAPGLSVLAAAVACTLTACGNGTAAPARSTGTAARGGAGTPVAVAASTYPLAQLVSYIGGADVRVLDLAGPGAQPQDLRLGAGQRAEVAKAALLVYVGYGYQPEVEAAAHLARRQLAVLPAVSKQPRPYQFWLDPYLMAKAAGVIAAALSAADPAGQRQFENGSRDFQALAQSIESDFVSSFSQCLRSYFVTADDAFERMASSFELVDVPVSQVGVAQAAAAVSERQLTEVFSEVGPSSSQIAEVARQAGVKVASLDPMELAPANGSSAPSYFSSMEQDLNTLEGGLDCDNTDSFS